ncbi:hypothetical protein TcG_11367 [Trypanosoma cruzi]|nr:hypothetical protein TcG_11367 [Trypanosoma cruzi]
MRHCRFGFLLFAPVFTFIYFYFAVPRTPLSIATSRKRPFFRGLQSRPLCKQWCSESKGLLLRSKNVFVVDRKKTFGCLAASALPPFSPILFGFQRLFRDPASGKEDYFLYSQTQRGWLKEMVLVPIKRTPSGAILAPDSQNWCANMALSRRSSPSLMKPGRRMRR